MVKTSDFGFLPENSAAQNSAALQKAVNCGGDVYVDLPGTYRVNDTVTIGNDTSIYFCNGSYLKRERHPEETGPVFINKGAYLKKYNHNIKICGLRLICDGVTSDGVNKTSEKGIMGISAHVTFYWIKHVEIRDFQCMDLPSKDFGIQICTFEDAVVENVHIEGLKDGVHFGAGSKFVLRHGLFKTFDDPIALNSYDYSISNPDVGWIENGVIEDCYDLNDEKTDGYFAEFPPEAGLTGMRAWRCNGRTRSAITADSIALCSDSPTGKFTNPSLPRLMKTAMRSTTGFVGI